MNRYLHLHVQARIRSALAVALLAGSVAMPSAWAQNDLKSGTLFSSGNTFDEQDGAALYTNICQGCHMSNAQGAVGAGRYPALAHNDHLASALYPAAVVAKGLRSMPAFAGSLDAKQIAAVVNYVRTHFGNNYPDALDAAAVEPLLK